ncbi:hypothetical protein VTL71DRAFT_3828 [Oculimacula yallundae]|uniref:2EXR domain-containing protein n=1 Tax=Oculimacula yallundae TaxID=86028 RepID=A0ABR4C4U8_9HELO
MAVPDALMDCSLLATSSSMSAQLDTSAAKQTKVFDSSAVVIAAHLPTSLAVNPHNPNNEFPKFSKLPLELRRMCFRAMFPGPRVIEMLFSKRQTSRKYELLAEIPVVLQICHDSRVEGLTRYRLACANKYALAPVYICPELDTVLFLGTHITVD